jgi:hypothetical protein
MPAEKRFALFPQAAKTSDLPAAPDPAAAPAPAETATARRCCAPRPGSRWPAATWLARGARYTGLSNACPRRRGQHQPGLLELRASSASSLRRLLHEALTQNPTRSLKAALARFRDVRN